MRFTINRTHRAMHRCCCSASRHSSNTRPEFRVTADHLKVPPRYHGAPHHSHDRRTFFKKVKDERTFDDVGSEEIRKRGNVHADVERTTTAVPLAICRSKEIRTAGSQVPTTRHVSLYLTVPFDSRYHRKR